MKFFLVTVIYNCFIENSTKLRSDTVEVEYIFVDNSTTLEIKEKNQAYCNENHLRYIDMHGNFGLPKAYNEAIKNIEINEQNWILISDDDTNFPENFLDNYIIAIRDNPQKKVFVPIINDSVGIMSPAQQKGKKFVHSIETDFNSHIENYSFINSGTCINSKVFESITYDENLFLDYVDHDFVNSVKEKFGNDVFFVIQDLKINQNFSGVSNNSFESDFSRFKIYAKDLKYYHQKWYGTKKTAIRQLYLRAVKLCLKHKCFDFLKVLYD